MGSTPCTFVLLTQAKGPPQNYHKAIPVLTWDHQSAKSDLWRLLHITLNMFVYKYVCIPRHMFKSKSSRFSFLQIDWGAGGGVVLVMPIRTSRDGFHIKELQK